MEKALFLLSFSLYTSFLEERGRKRPKRILTVFFPILFFHSFFLEKEKSGNGREKMFAIIGESDSVYCCGRVIGIVE